MNYMTTTIITTILTLALCVYIYRAKSLITFLAALVPVGFLFITADFISRINIPMYWLLIITLATGFVVFSLGDSYIHLTPFILAPLISSFIYMFVGVLIEGYLDPFWFMAVLPLLLITALISIFWGMFIFFLRRE